MSSYFVCIFTIIGSFRLFQHTDKDSINTLKVRRSMTRPHAAGNMYVIPSTPNPLVDPYGSINHSMSQPDLVQHYPIEPAPRYQADQTSQDFDELIFALKTGRGYAPPSDVTDLHGGHDLSSPGQIGTLERRRIAIADTHL